MLRTTSELFWQFLHEEAAERGWLCAIAAVTLRLVGVLRDTFPDRRRMRYGDIQFDLDNDVNTTWANIGFATRVREAVIGATYQTTDPLIFQAAMEMLQRYADVAQFTFVDLGSGKGRVLLLAAEYPFRRLVGVELLPELHAVARQNVYSFNQRLTGSPRGAKAPAVPFERVMPGQAEPDSRFTLVCGDARDFAFPNEPLVVFLFNPFPAWVVRAVMRNLQESVKVCPRPAFVVLHNAKCEAELAAAPALKRLGGTMQFALYGAMEPVRR